MEHNYTNYYKNITIRPLSEEDIELLRIWRNDESNSKYLTKIEKITPSMQKAWYLNYLNNKDELIFAIQETYYIKQLIGSIALYNIEERKAELGKFLIGEAKAHKRKLGEKTVIAALDVAFNLMKLEEIYLHVNTNNIAALTVYKNVGFAQKNEINNGVEEIGMSITKDKFNKFFNSNIFEKIEFKQYGDERGHLVVIEGLKDIPFEIKRIFYIYGSDSGVVRGKHANEKSEFVLINIAGSSKVKIIDNNLREHIVELNKPHEGIYIPKMIWKEMYDFSEDSLLLCLSNEHFDATEYIRDYEEYKKRVINE